MLPLALETAHGHCPITGEAGGCGTGVSIVTIRVSNTTVTPAQTTEVKIRLFRHCVQNADGVVSHIQHVQCDPNTPIPDWVALQDPAH